VANYLPDPGFIKNFERIESGFLLTKSLSTDQYYYIFQKIVLEKIRSLGK